MTASKSLHENCSCRLCNTTTLIQEIWDLHRSEYVHRGPLGYNAVWYVLTSVSEERIASIFSAEFVLQIRCLFTICMLCNCTAFPIRFHSFWYFNDAFEASFRLHFYHTFSDCKHHLHWLVSNISAVTVIRCQLCAILLNCFVRTGTNSLSSHIGAFPTHRANTR
jgi:uncharacterized membrane protein YesL